MDEHRVGDAVGGLHLDVLFDDGQLRRGRTAGRRGRREARRHRRHELAPRHILFLVSHRPLQIVRTVYYPDTEAACPRARTHDATALNNSGAAVCSCCRWPATPRRDGARADRRARAGPVRDRATDHPRIASIPIRQFDGSVSVARTPPSGDGPSAIEPPYSSARSRTMASPRPVPGALSSARTPRCSTAPTIDASSPGPSSSTVIATVVSPDADDTRARDRAHLHALSIRLPSISSRSSRSPRNVWPASQATSMATARSAWSGASVRASACADASTAQTAPGVAPDGAARACAR